MKLFRDITVGIAKFLAHMVFLLLCLVIAGIAASPFLFITFSILTFWYENIWIYFSRVFALAGIICGSIYFFCTEYRVFLNSKTTE